ncbi:hypothetical protein VNI00_001508 [Paramarasmius palmivorus]|uniref:Presequence protease, mitochondrial n=1 Tax=Paramarasmius palmivorus TaxID=297713 RepID=A0AAW0E4B0_9AGAR
MSSPNSSSPSESFQNFDLIKRVKLAFTDVTVSKWKSRVTGLSVVHLDYEAPLVSGYFVVATEIFNDSGCPHTLEHLVFMGSQKYPYKGIIDHFANRGFSNGTNAWTDNDHTAYTVVTAGEQGFLQLLPIYVDHILYPTITKAGFVTEVHHIDPKGHDSGVVYSEMQGRENTSGDLMALRMQRLLDPPESAYRSETGGLMEALRVLTVEQIRDYHASYYVPHNLVLIVAGKLSSGTSSLLKVVQEQVEPSLIAHGQNKGPRPPGWKRPFVETPSAIRPPLTSSVQETVEFPDQDEKDTRATRVELPIYLGSVPAAHLDTFKDKLQDSLKRIIKEGIDMERMAMVINRDERQLRSKLESAKGDTFSGTIITDFLYGAEDGSEIEASMDEINQYAEIRRWSSKQWTDLLQKYYVDPPSVTVVGRPSASLAEKLEKDEKARVAEQVKKLGPEGLKKAEKELEEAKAEHDKPIPPEVLKEFSIPDVKSIAWIPVQTLAKHINADGQELPFFVQYDHVESDFVSVHAFFSLKDLPDRLRKHISTYLSTFFALPVNRMSGERLTHEDVVNRLDDETVSYEVSLGVSSAFSQTLRVSIKVETAAYETAIAWLRDLVYGAEFTKDRLQVIIAKVQQSLPEMKRDGNTVLGSVWADLLYDETSTSRAGGLIDQVDFIPKLAKQLQEAPEEVMADFEAIRKHLIEPSGLRFSVTGNVLKLGKPRSVWAKYFNSIPETPLTPVPLSSENLSKVGQNPVKKAIIMSLPTIESSYVTHSTTGIKGFEHPKYPAFRVALEVLNATESYLWRYIRGSGLAYGAYVSLDLESGLLSFSLYRSSNSMGAYREAQKVIQGLADHSVVLDDTTLEAAKSSIVYGVTKSISTAGRAAITSFTNQALKNVPQNYQVGLLEKFQAVTKEDVLDVLRAYFLPLFKPDSSVAVVVTAPSKVEEIEKNLKEVGFDVEKRTLEVDPNEVGEDGSEDDSDESESDSNASR